LPLVPVIRVDPSEFEPHPAPYADRSARRVKGGGSKREIPVRGGRKRTRDKVPRIVIRRDAELPGRVVMAIEQVVNLREELEARAHLVVSAQVRNSIAGRRSRPEIVETVRRILVIFVPSRERTGHRPKVQIHKYFGCKLVVHVRFQHVLRNLWNMISRLHGDVAVQACPAVVGAIAAAVQRLRALVGRVEERVTASYDDFSDSPAEICLDPFPLRSAEVGEIAKAGLQGCHKEKIVVILAMKPPNIPAQIAVSSIAHARFKRPGNDLLQRRISDKGIRQIARFVRIGAPQFDGCGRSAGLAVVKVNAREAERPVSSADGWIETVENVLAIQGTARSGRVRGEAIRVVDGCAVCGCSGRRE
jgi:hypothetical protein